MYVYSIFYTKRREAGTPVFTLNINGYISYYILEKALDATCRALYLFSFFFHAAQWREGGGGSFLGVSARQCIYISNDKSSQMRVGGVELRG